MPLSNLRSRILLFPALAAAALALTAAGPPVRGKTLVIGSPGTTPILPPEIPWTGKSEQLLRSPDDPWATPFEKGDQNSTPHFAETVEWLSRLAEASADLKMISLGKSPEGRDIWMVVASRGQAFTPADFRKSKKPSLLIQAGIHGGEIDGKDAGMMLLRDMIVGAKTSLLDAANLLFIPILNVDGHERFSPFNRMNQRGPWESGWRTNARNRNLNRDYTKLETPEIRAVVAAIQEWEPDLLVDVHVSDGADYQYDITWGYNGPHAYSPNASAWLDAYLTPAVTAGLEAMGHTPGPLVFAVDSLSMAKGNYALTIGPRLSTGYGDARHLPSVLVETHALKSFKRRVLGTYVFLERTLAVLGLHGSELERAANTDRKARRRSLPLGWKASPSTKTVSFLGIRSRLVPSAASGGLRIEYTGEPVTLDIPLIAVDTPTVEVTRPKAYWIPPEWNDVAERLRLHGVEMEVLEEAREVPATLYRIEDAAVTPGTYEGHVLVTGTPVPEKALKVFPPGSIRVSTDQPLGDLAMLLLEPGSPDSFFQWGFFLEILRGAEYGEDYVMEPLAAEMLAGDPELAAEFREKLASDPAFAGSARARLRWFYERTPFVDHEQRLYPVAREE